MTIQVELDPETQARLAALSAQRGMGLQEYAQKLIEFAVTSGALPPRGLSVEEFHRMLDELAEGADALPHLPNSALSRESIYEDHP